MPFGLLSGIGSVLGGLGGLFGKKKSPSPASNLVSQAQGARQAADKYGFNPLTMLQYGQPGGAMGGGGGAAPLASVQMIVDGLKSVDDVVSGDAARRRAADQLDLDLAQLKLDQARSGVLAVAPQYAVNGVGSGPSPLGVRPVTVYTSNGGTRGGGNENADQPHPLADQLGDVDVPDLKLDRASPAYYGGLIWEATPGFSPGEVWEERYGDTPLNWGVAGGQLAGDIGFNVHKAQNYAVGGMFGAGPVMTVNGQEFVMNPYVPKAKRPKELPEYYTHPQTGFTAKRRLFGM